MSHPLAPERRRSGSRLKTYSLLERERRLPREYELVTSRLLYYTERGFEVKTPLSAWYDQHQRGSLLQAADWERFVDPRETTYAKYTALSAKSETYLDGLFEAMQTKSYDAALSPEWRATLARTLGPLRYPIHGFQMIAAYFGQMAPGGRIIVAALFQTADEMRRIQHLAYRSTLLEIAHPGFVQESKALWMRDSVWQPLREAVERCLVCYDWAEALVALNLCIKPVIDDLFMVHLAKEAHEHDDHVLGQLFSSLHDDCRWHRQWTLALLRTAIEQHPTNADVVRSWVARWSGTAERAVAPFQSLFQKTASPLPALSTLVASLAAEAGVEER